MPAKAMAVPTAPQKSDTEIAVIAGVPRIAHHGAMFGLGKLTVFANEYQRRKLEPYMSVHPAYQSHDLTLAETAKAVILLAEATAEAFKAELG